MEKITLAATGRIAYGVAIIVFGTLHFTNAKPLLDLMPSYLPGGAILWVYLVGIALTLVGISIVILKLNKTSCIFLAIMFTLFNSNGSCACSK